MFIYDWRENSDSYVTVSFKSKLCNDVKSDVTDLTVCCS